MTTLVIDRPTSTIKPSGTEPHEPLSMPERNEQPRQYTIVFTDVHREDPPERLGYTREQLDEMYRRHANMIFYSAVVGEKPKKNSDAEIMAIEDRLTIVRATPYICHADGYIFIEKPITTPHYDFRDKLEKALGRENFNLMVDRLHMKGMVIFDHTNGYHLTLFPVAPMPDISPDIERSFAERIGRSTGYPFRSIIIPTMSRKPFPNTTITENELRRMAYLHDRAEASEFYDMIHELFERADGDPNQFLPFDHSLVPEQYREWDIMDLEIDENLTERNWDRRWNSFH